MLAGLVTTRSAELGGGPAHQHQTLSARSLSGDSERQRLALMERPLPLLPPCSQGSCLPWRMTRVGRPLTCPRVGREVLRQLQQVTASFHPQARGSSLQSNKSRYHWDNEVPLGRPGPDAPSPPHLQWARASSRATWTLSVRLTSSAVVLPEERGQGCIRSPTGTSVLKTPEASGF